MNDQKDWSTVRDRAGSLHILPNNDLEEHPRRWDCGCRPVFEAIPDGIGEFSWIFLHNALDGRID